MAILLSFEAARARETLRKAEMASRRAQDLVDTDCGVGINFALVNRIRAAERRVERARAALTKIDPTSAE